MFQIDVSTAATAQPASTAAGTPGFFTDGNPATGVAATVLPAEFMNALMLEMLNVVKAAGITPSKTAFNQLANAIKGLSQQGGAVYGADTGTANTYAVAYDPAVAALTDGMVVRFAAKTANTGASTFSPNGLAAKPVLTTALQTLIGGEIVAAGICTVMYSATQASWILMGCTGGMDRVATASTSTVSTQTASTAFVWSLIQLFGLGSTTGPVVDDLNNLTQSGFYRALSTAGNLPVAQNSVLLNVQFSSNGSFQLAAWLAPTTANARLYWRTQAGGVWSSWREVAMLSSPAFTDSPTAPTAAAGDSSKLLCTTAFAQGLAKGFTYKDVSGSANVTLTAAEAGVGVIVLQGTITANINVILPSAGQWIVSNRTSGSYLVTVCGSAADAGIQIASGKNSQLWSNATNVFVGSSDPHGISRFTASGTFTVPAGVTTLYVSGCGGGGGGGGGAGYNTSNSSYYAGGGGGGGAGSQAIRTPISVTPGLVVNVTIGAAGAAGVSGATGATGGNGGDGGSTAFGTALTLAGGGGGKGGTGGSSSASGGAGGAVGGSFGADGQSTFGGSGGSGGGGSYGSGGGAGRGGLGAGVAAIAGAGYGAGGGGGGGCYGNSGVGGSGGAGMPGCLIIEW